LFIRAKNVKFVKAFQHLSELFLFGSLIDYWYCVVLFTDFICYGLFVAKKLLYDDA